NVGDGPPARLTAPVPSVPVVPPLPICSVPALTVVAPLYVLAPVSVSVPAPSFVNAPVPLIALATANESLRLNVRAALFTTAPVPSVPIVPPLPIWSVPAEIVVVPPYVFAPVSV